MKRPIFRLLLCATLAGGFAVPPGAFAADDPAAYFDNECVDCHKIKKKPIEDKQLSREEWLKAIEKMIQLEKLDPVPSKDYIATLLDWLVKNHGPGATAGASVAPAAESAKTQ